jgi:hypothetical protein
MEDMGVSMSRIYVALDKKQAEYQFPMIEVEVRSIKWKVRSIMRPYQF